MHQQCTQQVKVFMYMHSNKTLFQVEIWLISSCNKTLFQVGIRLFGVKIKLDFCYIQCSICSTTVRTSNPCKFSAPLCHFVMLISSWINIRTYVEN